jgi:hypothetical protein
MGELPARRITMYSQEVHAPEDVRVGEVLPLVRGDGIREGELMGWVSVRAHDEGGGVSIEIVAPPEQPPGDAQQ